MCVIRRTNTVPTNVTANIHTVAAASITATVTATATATVTAIINVTAVVTLSFIHTFTVPSPLYPAIPFPL